MASDAQQRGAHKHETWASPRWQLNLKRTIVNECYNNKRYSRVAGRVGDWLVSVALARQGVPKGLVRCTVFSYSAVGGCGVVEVESNFIFFKAQALCNAKILSHNKKENQLFPTSAV